MACFATPKEYSFRDETAFYISGDVVFFQFCVLDVNNSLDMGIKHRDIQRISTLKVCKNLMCKSVNFTERFYTILLRVFLINTNILVAFTLLSRRISSYEAKSFILTEVLLLEAPTEAQYVQMQFGTVLFVVRDIVNNK